MTLEWPQPIPFPRGHSLLLASTHAFIHTVSFFSKISPGSSRTLAALVQCSNRSVAQYLCDQPRWQYIVVTAYKIPQHQFSKCTFLLLLLLTDSPGKKQSGKKCDEPAAKRPTRSNTTVPNWSVQINPKNPLGLWNSHEIKLDMFIKNWETYTFSHSDGVIIHPWRKNYILDTLD